jgi:hypothetical protein
MPIFGYQWFSCPAAGHHNDRRFDLYGPRGSPSQMMLRRCSQGPFFAIWTRRSVAVWKLPATNGWMSGENERIAELPNCGLPFVP